MVWLNVLTRHLQPQAIQARERAQIRAIKDSIGHVEVFQMDGVGTPIIGRPRPLPGHDTPNPANNTYTLNYEEPYKNAIDDQIQDATSVLDAFHIVKLAGDAPGEVRRRVQQDTTGHRARTGDPLYPGPQSLARLAHTGSPHANKNAPVRPSRQIKHTSVSTSPTTAPSKSETSYTKTHPPKANAWPHTSSSVYQPVPSPKSPD